MSAQTPEIVGVIPAGNITIFYAEIFYHLDVTVKTPEQTEIVITRPRGIDGHIADGMAITIEYT